ncbi:MAG: alpha/beta hydrolase [Treponemataceae bacterium]|nr:alpha/beta hydrolase [Treponemataceae bacterium]
MICQKINLPVQYAAKGIKNNGFQPTLTTYILDTPEYYGERKRPLVLVCPGGGYAYTSDREAEPIALKMTGMGFNACVLRYSCAPMDFPAALLDAAEAMYYIRVHADEWNVDPEQIYVCGFSAGSHLAASFGVFWNSGLIQEYLSYKPEEMRPDGLLLCYPVITSGEKAHHGSITNVLGSQATDPEMVAKMSLENQVTKDVPPVFIWHTFEDGAVPVENSLLFASALRKENIPFELHIFEHGAHGLSLANAETSLPDMSQINDACAVWPELAAKWILGRK